MSRSRPTTLPEHPVQAKPARIAPVDSRLKVSCRDLQTALDRLRLAGQKVSGMTVKRERSAVFYLLEL